LILGAVLVETLLQKRMETLQTLKARGYLPQTRCHKGLHRLAKRHVPGVKGQHDAYIIEGKAYRLSGTDKTESR
jgi:hypothetical protein